jgi:hypothetical protein
MTYDFYDFGASKGGSIQFARTNFGGRGLGLDIDPKKIAALRERGFRGEVADLATEPATDLLAEGAVRYVTMFHFLEHLPNAETGARVISNAVRAARDFVVMVGPDFEDGEYLRALGLAKYYGNWSGHTWHHSEAELRGVLSGLGHPFTMLHGNPIRDSWSHAIQPFGNRVNAYQYDPNRDPAKPFVVFERRLYETIAFVVNISGKFAAADIVLRLGFLLGADVTGDKPAPFYPQREAKRAEDERSARLEPQAAA